MCQYNPRTPSHVAAAPDHPRTVQVREDVLLAETFRGLAAYALAPGREQRLAELIPHTATARQAQHDRQAAALAKRLKRLTARQDNLMRELDESFDMADEAGEAYRRRIRADYADPAHRTQGHRDAAHRPGRRHHPGPRPGPGQPAARSHRRPGRPAARPASRTIRRL